ncbi:MAG: energy transducer TonB [Bacteroidales bacterium]|nr:energy transducer TonB [Bacteroidales bacterium]
MNAKLFTLAAIIGLLTFTSVYADEDKNLVKQTVRQQIDYPEFAIEENLEGTVWVEFTVNESGKIKVGQINSACIPLKNYVLNKLEGMEAFKLVDASKEKYQMYFDFHLL